MRRASAAVYLLAPLFVSLCTEMPTCKQGQIAKESNMYLGEQFGCLQLQ